MGNDGVHDLDIGRWGLGVETHPSSVTALGGKYFFDDDQEFPDTQTVIFEWPAVGKEGRKKQLIFEQRIWTPYKMEGYENGCAFYGTRGMFLVGHSEGWKLFLYVHIEATLSLIIDDPRKSSVIVCAKALCLSQATSPRKHSDLDSSHASVSDDRL